MQVIDNNKPKILLQFKFSAFGAELRNRNTRREGISNECYLDKEKLDDILAGAEKNVFDIVQRRGSSDFVNIRDIVIQSLDNIEAASRNKGAVTGIATGFYVVTHIRRGRHHPNQVGKKFNTVEFLRDILLL